VFWFFHSLPSGRFQTSRPSLLEVHFFPLWDACELLDNFFTQLGLRASTREVFRGKKSEIRQPDDYRLHGAEFSNLRNQDEGKA
jgi:hypothetical protein